MKENTMAHVETSKLMNHLALLKQEYTKLQERYDDLEKKYSSLCAASGTSSKNTFAGQLLEYIDNLYNSKTYSDLKIKVANQIIPGHKLVLSVRSDVWSEEVLGPMDILDLSKLEEEVSEAILFWIYKDKIELKNDNVTIKVIEKAYEYKLHGLLNKCEKDLITSVCVENCVKFYSVAEQVNANKLKEYCSEIISIYWNDLKSLDFEHMSGPLLYEMLKSKTQFPLHSAVKLQREDVVFLYLVDNSTRSNNSINTWDPNGELPLDLALRAHNFNIASTLLQYNADINLLDSEGDTLLHRTIKREDPLSVLYILENKTCDVSLCTLNSNDTALHLIAGGNIKDSYTIVKKLVEKSVNINAQNKQGLTPLHIAIMSNNDPIFSLLLEQPFVDINLKSNDEHTPLYYSLLKYQSGDRSSESYASRLIEKGVKTNPIYLKSGNSLLQTLIMEGAQDAAIFLSKYENNLDHINEKGESVIHLACLKNYPLLVNSLISCGVNPNLLTNDLMRSPLHYAVLGNSADCIKSLIKANEISVADNLEAKINFNLKDINGDTPLSLSLNENHKDLLPLLMEGKGDINVRNSRDLTLLHQAILKEDSETALFLLENGADINAITADGETPLQLAIHCRLPDVVDALCSEGVDMSAPDGTGNCPLWAALESNQENVASILVRHGADTDCWGPGPEGCRQTLLHKAIDENKESIAIFLIQSGCDLDSPQLPGPNGEGSEIAKERASPLHMCCQWGLQTVIQTLIEHGANVNSRDVEGKTPLHIAIENQHAAIINLLLCVPNIDLSLRDKKGSSPFATALTVRNNKAAQAILDRFPSAAEQFDSKGNNFLHTAIKRGDKESILFLLSIHVDVNSRVQDPTLITPLHLMAKYGDEMLIRSLIIAGARIEDRDAQKNTALHVAAQVGNAEVTSGLIQSGIDVDACNHDGDNALHIAVREGHLNVVKVLLTESNIDAEHLNIKGRNPLHELCRCGKENAAAICDFFLECMPDYPINKPDLDGNTPLLLAYMKGNGNLCRILVKANACLAAENNERVTIFNYQVATKQLLYRLLDQLSQQVPWTQTDMCQECGKNFTVTIRRHHCRHCGRILCSKCSSQEVPIIKFGENKPVRVCKVCFDVLKTGIQ